MGLGELVLLELIIGGNFAFQNGLRFTIETALRAVDSENQAKFKNAGRRGRPISTVFLLGSVLNQLVTMVTFICQLASLFPKTDHPPPQKKK